MPLRRSICATMPICWNPARMALEGAGRELIDNPHVRTAYLAG